MKKSLLQNSTYRFLILFLGTFALLYYFNIFYIGIVAPGGYYSPFLAEHFNYIEGLRTLLLNTSAWILRNLGYQVNIIGIWFRVVHRGGFMLAYDCLGYGVMSFFSAFVLAYPKSLKSKVWFLPAGLLLIQTLNVLRFVLLGLFWKHSDLRRAQVIDHHEIFNIVLYIVLLGVIYIWINKRGTKAKIKHGRNEHSESNGTNTTQERL